VHIVHPDGRIIPFDTYNMFYRDERERTLLARLRGEEGAAADGALVPMRVAGAEVPA
jgi:uncharacterized radical SAM superfamily Fe-S cluster-containing enzyme